MDNFTVNVTGDADELVFGDNVCDSDVAAGNQCTLRGAIGETSDGDPSTDVDTIGFSGAPVGATIQLGSALTTILEPLSINGCSGAPNTVGPCVGVRGSSTAINAFLVAAGGEPATIRGLAITNSNRGVRGGNDSAGLTIRNDWFGIKLDGTTAEGNNIGVELTDQNPVIGGTAGATGITPADRNIFANNTDGLVLAGDADNATIQGNYFGVAPNGSTLAANNQNIKLAGDSLAAPSGTLIGGTQPVPGTCSGPCNTISGATTNGINVNLGAGPEPDSTTIKGNFIGLDAAGTAAIGNGTGILVTNGPDTTIGGPAAGDRNYITGGGNGIFSNFQGAPNLRIENNFIGTNTAGTASLDPPTNLGMSIQSDEAEGAQIVDNVVSMDDSTGVDAIQFTMGTDPLTPGATLDGNSIGVGTGGQTLDMGSEGVRTIGLRSTTITNNTIGNTSLSALTLEGGEDNTLTGNRLGVDANGGAEPNTNRGILITNTGLTDSTGYTIGGTTAASENVISNTGGDAIEMTNASDLQGVPAIVHNDDNVIGRNHGTNNGTDANDLFIDLWDDFNNVGEGPGNPGTGPNHAIAAPQVTSATDDVVAGGSASSNATVLIFETPDTGVPGDITSFLGQATASGAGAWQLPVNIPNATRVTALQTDASGDSSELSSSLAAVADPPETTITGGPRKRSRLKPGKRMKKVTLTFTSSEPGEGGFQCQIDSKPFVLCSSPFVRKLKKGKHIFRVRAYDDAANPDPSLAIRSFRILRSRRR